MEIATYVRNLNEVERCCCARTLPEFRRAVRQPDLVEELGLGRCVGERTKRLHVVRRACRAEQLRSETLRWCHDERDWKTVHCQAYGPPLLALDERDDRGEVREPFDDAVRIL